MSRGSLALRESVLATRKPTPLNRLMAPNETLSITNELREERPDDYDENVATIEWPLSVRGEAFPILGAVHPAVAFKDDTNRLRG